MLDFKKAKIEDIIEWCKANNEVAWLKEEAEKKVTQKRHTGRVKGISKKTGKEVWFVDKSSPIEEIETPITFIQIKMDFFNKFFPELAPKPQEKKKTMFDLIAEL